MFIRLKNDKVISLSGKALAIIRLPDRDNTGITMQFALVIVHNTADPPPPAASETDGSNDAYWNKFEILAECVTHDAGEIRLGDPLEPLLDKICDALRVGAHLLDWRSEKTYLTFDDVLKMNEAAERKQMEREARTREAAQRQRDFKGKL